MSGFVGVMAALIAAAAAGVSPAGAGGVAQLAWLAGCWEAVSARRTVEEHWMAPRGASMLGASRTVRGDSLVEYELVLLREEGGGVVYEAQPSGQPAATFRSTLLTDSSAVFENLEHDFPQRIGYRLQGADSLVAWIEGPRGGEARRVEFPYRRARCPGR